MLKKFSLDKISGTTNAHFSLSQAPTHDSFTFNLRFLYELRHKVRLSKTVCGILHFRFRIVFIKVYIFVQQKHGLSGFENYHKIAVRDHLVIFLTIFPKLFFI